MLSIGLWNWFTSLTSQEKAIIVTGVLGIWGAGLSTYNTVVQRSEKRRRLRIRFEKGAVFDVSTSSQSEPRALVRIINSGHVPVTLSAISFFYRRAFGKEWLTFY